MMHCPQCRDSSNLRSPTIFSHIDEPWRITEYNEYLDEVFVFESATWWSAENTHPLVITDLMRTRFRAKNLAPFLAPRLLATEFGDVARHNVP